MAKEEKNVINGKELLEEELGLVNGGKDYNSPEGFTCPNCKIGRIKISLYSFLYDNFVQCPACGLRLSIDKAQCSEAVEKLQDLYYQTQEAERLKRESGNN